MLHRLNYYSRYNRIKTPKEIDTLYHLFQDLNIDAIVNDDFISRISALREAHIKDKNESKKISKQNQQKNSRREQQEYSKKLRSDYNQKLGFYQKYTQRSGSLEPKQHSIQSLQLEAPQKNSINASFGMSNNKTRNLQWMHCLQTQPISQSLKQIEIKEQNSPIFKLKQQQFQAKEIQKGEIKQYESQYFETSIKQKQGYIFSNFDEFSEGLGQLNKVVQIRKSSYFKDTVNNQNHIKSAIQQDYYSEQLDRFCGSDIEMQTQHIYQYQNKYYQEEVEVEIEVEKESQRNQIMIQENADNADNVEDNQDYNSIMPILYIDDFREQVKIQEQYQLENQEQQQKNQQSSCIGIKASIFIQEQNNLDSPILKITGNDLTQGKQTINQTKQQIQSTMGADSLMAPLVTSNPNNEKQRKPFKKMIMDRKLNSRLVTSTIVHDPPVKKVNFKKMMKKQRAENIGKLPMIQNKPIKDIKQPQQKKSLLKAFFDQN